MKENRTNSRSGGTGVLTARPPFRLAQEFSAMQEKSK